MTTDIKIYLETYGCQMNVYDSELVCSILKDAGYSFTETENEASVILMNTCTVRKHASDKVLNRVLRLRHERKGKPTFIGILGCLVSDLKDDLIRDPRYRVDFAAGPDSYRTLPGLIETVLRNEEKKAEYNLSEFETYSDLLPLRKEGVNAWTAIMRGCNNFCSFCIVPYTRGRERSRTPENILDEVNNLADKGFVQISLLGQNVNSYKSGNNDFTDLLKMISEIDKIKRIRFMSPHPKDFPLKLIELMKKNTKICRHIHLPLQAGNNRILKKMNRGYTQEEFLNLAEHMKKELPGLVLSTDVIIGFPGETEEEFNDTVKVMEKVRFDSAFIFKYSERTGTLASKKFPDDVLPEEKTRRITYLNKIQRIISKENNTSRIDTIQEVLVESDHTKKSSSDVQARNDGNQVVIIPKGAYDIGDFIKVRINGASSNVLMGVPC